MAIQRRSRRMLSAFVAVVLLVAAAWAVSASNPPSAQAFCSGTGCLPGSGYTYDGTWNCGATTAVCYEPGTTNYGSAYIHTYGWGSADYDGAGATTVNLCAVSSGSCYFGGAGTNLIRACYNDNCNDQNAIGLKLGVSSPYESHTINGHGKA